MPRLFVALAVPDAADDALHALCHSVPGARWTLPGDFHLTLRFVGDVGPEAFRDLREALARVKGPPFTLALKGVGHFPFRGPPRVLWAGAHCTGDPPHPPALDPLALLQREVEKLVVGLGHRPDGRNFHAHVTLARLGEGRGVSDRVAQFLAANGLWRTEPFTVDAVHLYSSRTYEDGPQYHIEETYPLTESP
jgi:2'-5' RNA ligase